MFDPEDLDATHLMTHELGPVLRDYDIQHLLEDVEDAVYAGVPYELPTELIEGHGHTPPADQARDDSEAGPSNA